MLTVDGKLTVSSATADIGTGTYTVMTQIAAELLGLPMEDVTFKLGDSSLPEVAGRGRLVHGRLGRLGGQGRLRRGPRRRCSGSPGRSTARRSPRRRSTTWTSPTAGSASRDDPSRSVSIAEAMRHGGVDVIEEEDAAEARRSRTRYSRLHALGDLRRGGGRRGLRHVRVTRVVTAIAGGRILNPKTARSQVMGGIVWGIGMALHEESVIDHRFGRFMTTTSPTTTSRSTPTSTTSR